MNSISDAKNEPSKPKSARVDAVINAVRHNGVKGEMWLMNGLTDGSFDGVLLGDREEDDVVLGDELLDGFGYLIVSLGKVDELPAGVFVVGKDYEVGT